MLLLSSATSVPQALTSDTTVFVAHQAFLQQAMFNRRESLRGIRIPEIQKEIELAVLPLTLFEWLSVGFKVRRREASLMLAGSLSLD